MVMMTSPTTDSPLQAVVPNPTPAPSKEDDTESPLRLQELQPEKNTLSPAPSRRNHHPPLNQSTTTTTELLVTQTQNNSTNTTSNNDTLQPGKNVPPPPHESSPSQSPLPPPREESQDLEGPRNPRNDDSLNSTTTTTTASGWKKDERNDNTHPPQEGQVPPPHDPSPPLLDPKPRDGHTIISSTQSTTEPTTTRITTNTTRAEAGWKKEKERDTHQKQQKSNKHVLLWEAATPNNTNSDTHPGKMPPHQPSQPQSPPVLPRETATARPQSQPPHSHPTLPNVLLAGVPKAGTSAITRFLLSHYGSSQNNICLAQPRPGQPHTAKEPHFFDDILGKLQREQQQQKQKRLSAKRHSRRTSALSPTPEQQDHELLSAYTRLFAHCRWNDSESNHHYHNNHPNNATTITNTTLATAATGPRLILDATPDSFSYPKEIFNFYHRHSHPDALAALKIVVILREPMSRELSWYHHRVFDVFQAAAAHQPPPPYARAVLRHAEAWRHLVPSHNSTNITNTTSHHTPIIQKNMNTIIQPFRQYWSGWLMRQYRCGRRNKANLSFYVWWLRQWFHYFGKDRRHQILVASYDEFSSQPDVFLSKLVDFLGLPTTTTTTTVSSHNPKELNTTTTTNNHQEPPFGKNQTSSWSKTTTTSSTTTTTAAASVVSSLSLSSSSTPTPPPRVNDKHTAWEDTPPCGWQRRMFDFFEPYNERLYQLLNDNDLGSTGRPPQETTPFPRFVFRCHQPKQQQQPPPPKTTTMATNATTRTTTATKSRTPKKAPLTP
ncbi:hypothetical protein ACA910_020607 [Epithemia clementina (nom. ined.)]